MRRPLVGVGAIVWKEDQVLLIQRGKDPGRGRWSIPGGHLEWGETCDEGAVRELREETGIKADLIGLVHVYNAIHPGTGTHAESHYVLINYCFRWRAGDPVAGDDALDARWMTRKQCEALDLWADVRDAIEKSQNMIIHHREEH